MIGAILAGIFFTYLAFHVPDAIDYWKAREPIRQLGREADRYGLTYGDVLRNPTAAIGKPVRWFVTHPGDQWFYRGNASMLIVWEDQPPEMVETGQSGSSHGETIIAHVVEVTQRGVVLRAYLMEDAKTTTNSFRLTH